MATKGRVPSTGAFLSRSPFVGREIERARLQVRFEEASAGRGGLLMLVGEAGIGKTRTAEEFAGRARDQGAAVLWGSCYETEWAPPYGPFAQALTAYARDAKPEALRHDLGHGAGPVARLIPALRDVLPDIEEPGALQPDEERFRLFDAVSQFLIALSQRAPVVVLLDDLHWADRGTIAMLLHVARFARPHRILIIGAYRDVELGSNHPLAEVLGQLGHDTEYERLHLDGLARDEVGELLTAIAEQDLPEALADAIGRETDGNPFFLRETLLHLIETGDLHLADGVWTSAVTSIGELGIPEGVRQVVGQRLSRLSATAARLLTTASAFEGVFRFDIAAQVPEIDEQAGLEAIDEALAAHVLRSGSTIDTCEFAHAIIRHTLYAELSPPRKLRLHRRIAEVMEAVYGERAIEHAAELAHHYHRSATLPGAERGVAYAVAAADRAEAAYAHEDRASFLRIALDLLPAGDARQPRLRGRWAVALIWALDFDRARIVAGEAGVLIARAEGEAAAAEFLMDAADAMDRARAPIGTCFPLAEQGLRYAGNRRDVTWARLMEHELVRRRIEDPDDPEIFAESPAQLEVWRVIDGLTPDERRGLQGQPPANRQEVLRRYADNPYALSSQAGEYRRCLVPLAELGERLVQQGQVAQGAVAWATLARCHNALGDFPAARRAFERAGELAARVPDPNRGRWFGFTMYEMGLVINNWQDAAWGRMQEDLQQDSGRTFLSAGGLAAAGRAMAALGRARGGMAEEAVRSIGTIVEALTLGAASPPWPIDATYSISVGNAYTVMACDAAAALWHLNRTDHIDVIERGIREKIVEPDFRCPMRDGRHALALLSALQGRHDEAIGWFARAREVLDEQGARPLRAMVDYDEALMYVRRGRRGDRNRAIPLVEAALAQFGEIGMTGWVTLGLELQRQLVERMAGQAVYPDRLTPREVDVLRLITRGRTNANIASDLTLSVRTVGRHVTNLYTKIHARNRAEAVDYAHRHDLA